MVRIFCDRCGTELDKNNYRTISIGDGNGKVACMCGVPRDKETTLLSSDICVECAREIIGELKMDKGG